ncbi:hypothetical protein Y032_0023g797 [Ancylostoma ceylanicum]|uniref:BPTI/Kunitz inhibitor domain-containing protein n=2 Tax=Ancylostoma ceylanicum TaxID=53326 RepID=A0A016UY65_9BILA|nr:hypothetical protein Y032_0023g797 [Ancylostoma ceylanicum]
MSTFLRNVSELAMEWTALLDQLTNYRPVLSPKNMKLFLITLILLTALFTVCEARRDMRCLLPVDSGMCMASIRRWAYYPKWNMCSVFIYGGCGGNENNFETEQECRRICVI